MQNNQKDEKKVLLRIRNLKQYFPLKKNKKLFVRANDGIDLDIYESETLGLVGESGCGKSTLGRVILQLYHQTEGDTVFYGRELYSLAPKYILTDLKNYESNIKTIMQSASGGDKKAVNDLHHIAKIVGGFVISDNPQQIAAEYRALYLLAEEAHALQRSLKTLTVDREDRKSEGAKSDELNEKIKVAQAALMEKQKQFNGKKAEIDALRKPYVNNAEFQKYDNMLDNGIDLARLEYAEMRQLRCDIQLIFQDPYSSLNPRMTVGQIIGEGLKAHEMFNKDNTRYNDYIVSIMQECGLAPYMIHRYPHQFSGGQRQRIGIARSLAVKPKFVVCDEAVSALDVSIQSQILNLLQDLKEKENLTYMFISHDLSVVKYISDRIGVMYLGNIVELAKTEDIFANPRHPYTEALLMAIPTTDTDSKLEDNYLLEGDIPSPINPPKGCKFHTRCRYATDICKEDVPAFVEVGDGHFVACHLRSERYK